MQGESVAEAGGPDKEGSVFAVANGPAGDAAGLDAVGLDVVLADALSGKVEIISQRAKRNFKPAFETYLKKLMTL